MSKRLSALTLITLSTLTANETLPNYEIVPDKVSYPVLTPSLAGRKTAKIRLSNKLEAYLISDPGIDQSAAAIAVEAGSWSDPKEYPGMAHFCEHMLFMGTKAYPSEFEYMQYIADHGGSVNAYTASDRTVYMFSVNNDAFTATLDRFSHFFIDPLFMPQCIDRELHAVDQEHGKNIENDDWREYMIIKETGNKDHPNCAFSTGNAATLSGIPQKALKSWYEQNYSANRMHLIVLSSQPLEELTASVVEKFSPVENRNLPKQAYPFDLFSKEQLGHFIYIKPVKDIRSIQMLWQMPSDVVTDPDKDPASLVIYSLMSGTALSLTEQLKAEKIAESVSIGGERLSSDEAIFQITINLTEVGLKKIDTAIERVYQALARLKTEGVPKYIFDERQKMAITSFQYQTRQEAFDYVMQAAGTLMYEPLETYPQKTAIPTTFDPASVSQLLDSLTPQNCVYLVIADPKLMDVALASKEKWMQAEYTIKEISAPQLTAWAGAKPHPKIDIPEPNPFIPENLALVSFDKAQKDPILISDDEGSKIYFAADEKYQTPELSTLFSLKSPLQDGSPKARTLFDLYLYSLKERLYGTLYYSQFAGLSTSFVQQNMDLILAASGYSDKLPLLVTTLFKNLKEVHPTEEQFEIYKQALLSNYDNGSKELPLRQSLELLSATIYNDAPTSRAKYQALKNLTYDEFITFCKTAFHQSYVQAMIYGNSSKQQAQALWSEIKQTLGSQSYPVAEQKKKEILILSDRKGPFLLNQTTDRQGNSALLMLQEGPFSFERKAAQQILSTALQNAFFDTLRTKQQTAYIAKSWDAEVEKQLFQLFAVQSITHEPAELLARFELFLEEFNRHVEEKITPERFEILRDNLVKTLEMPPENQQGMAQQLFTLALQYEGDFNWIQKRIDAVKTISYQSLIENTHEFLSRDNLKRLAVLMEGVLPPDNTFRYNELTLDQVRTNGKFVSAKDSEEAKKF